MTKLTVFTVILIIIATICYTYGKGLRDGEQRYKQSRRMYKALESAYHFGYIDGREGRPEDWDGPNVSDIQCSTCSFSMLCIANVTSYDIKSIAKEMGFFIYGLPDQPKWVTLDGKECK